MSRDGWPGRAIVDRRRRDALGGPQARPLAAIGERERSGLRVKRRLRRTADPDPHLGLELVAGAVNRRERLRGRGRKSRANRGERRARCHGGTSTNTAEASPVRGGVQRHQGALAQTSPAPCHANLKRRAATRRADCDAVGIEPERRCASANGYCWRIHAVDALLPDLPCWRPWILKVQVPGFDLDDHFGGSADIVDAANGQPEGVDRPPQFLLDELKNHKLVDQVVW